jgi:hypothetical protein
VGLSEVQISQRWRNRNADTSVLLDAESDFGKLRFRPMAASVQFVPAETVTEFEFPQREAAFFYGLFLRGHSADKLRQDIEVAPAVLAKWHREAEREPELRDILSRIVAYRRHVLAIFDTLVDSENVLQRPQ